jgi:hypothetical protein
MERGGGIVTPTGRIGSASCSDTHAVACAAPQLDTLPKSRRFDSHYEVNPSERQVTAAAAGGWRKSTNGVLSGRDPAVLPGCE